MRSPLRAAGGRHRGTLSSHHLYASLLIAKGSSVKTIQRRLGHQSAMETLDTYGHLWPDREDETRNAFDDVLAGVTGQGSSRQAALAASTQ